MANNYPNDKDIRVEWTRVHQAVLLLTTIIVLGFLVLDLTSSTSLLTKYLSAGGLYVDIIGVTIASLKTPYYGAFNDGGEIERKREKVETKYFQSGMFLIAIGMILQVIAILL